MEISCWVSFKDVFQAIFVVIQKMVKNESKNGLKMFVYLSLVASL